jgi:predicted nucleic acid-binding protein
VGGQVPALDGGGVVLDAHPLVAFLEHEPGARAVAALLTRATAGEVLLHITTVNAGEVMLAIERTRGAEACHDTLDLLQELPLDLVVADLELAARAEWFRLRGGLSYADCFAAALAHKLAARVLTGDREFERVANLVEILWLDELEDVERG